MDKHRQTPWKLGNGIIWDAHGIVILILEDTLLTDDDAAFIVEAVNAYEKDQETIQILKRLLEKATGWTLEEIVQAIAKAEAQSNA